MAVRIERGENMKYVYRTDRGKVRNHNEDNGGVYENQSDQILAVVADGMGGHLAGDVASKMTTDLLKEYWQQVDKIESPDIAEQWLDEKIKSINEDIFQYAKDNPECQGMGTTVVASICTDQFLTIAHIGDSRGYLLNGDGFRQLTDDHSLVNELVKSGQISKQDAEHHPRKNVLLRALGTEQNVSIDTMTIGFEPGDSLLLCSDGLTNKVTDEELHQMLVSDVSLEYKAEQLINLANEKGGEDNISLAIIVNETKVGKVGD